MELKNEYTPNETTVNAINEVKAMEEDRTTIDKIYTNVSDMFMELMANA